MSERLLILKQGKRRVVEYALDFRTLVATSRLNNAALRAVYQQGLNDNILKVLAFCDKALSLDALINLSIKLDNISREIPNLRGRSLQPLSHQCYERVNIDRGSTSKSTPEPMEVNTSHLRSEESERRCRQGLCLYCGNNKHQLQSCPELPKNRSRGTEGRRYSHTLPVSVPKLFPIPPISIQVQIHLADKVFLLSAMIDSGAEGNLID